MPAAQPVYRGPKFLSRLQHYLRKANAPDGELTFTVEWLRVAGATGGGKVVVSVTIPRGGGLSNALRAAVADHLATLYPSENVRDGDVVLIGA